MNPTNHEPKKTIVAEGGLSLGGAVSIAYWNIFSLNHLFSAFHHSHLSKVIEENFKHERKVESWKELHKK